MPLALLLLIVGVFYAGSAHAQACLPGYPAGVCVIQPALGEGDDVAPYCYQAPLVRGQHETLYSLTSDVDGECHSFVDYMKFVLPANLLGPGQTVIESALYVPYTFSFVYQGTPTPPPHAPVTMRVHRVLAPWTEDAVTWDSKPSYVSLAHDEITGITAPATLEFNVTTLVRGWAHGTNPNYGFAITSPNDRAIGTYSWEAELTPAQRPNLVAKLVILVGSGSPPAIPIMPAWITALLVICVATVLALYMPRTRGRS